MVELFKALSDETRLRMLSLLLDGEMCVCEFEGCLGLTQSNASRHLSVLKAAGILSASKHAQWTYYRLNEDFRSGNEALIGYLSGQFRALPAYEADRRKKETYEQAELCGKKGAGCIEQGKRRGHRFF